MSVKIDWSSLTSTPDTVNLYWDVAPFTASTLPTNKISVDPSVKNYTDTTIPVNGKRYYMVEANKAGANTQYTQCLVYSNYPKTGPGATVPLRGDWNSGYFGLVPTAQMFTISQLRTAVGGTGLGTAPADSTMTGWHKFVFGGKILFMPNAPLTATSAITWAQLYNLGLVYGVDGPGAAPFDLTTASASPAIPTTVNQKKVVTVGSDSFLVRCPKISTLATNVNVADRTSLKGSEWWETACNLTTNTLAADAPNLPPFKWSDIATVPFPLAATQHFQGTSNCAVSNTNWSDFFLRPISGTVAAGWVTWVPILEYIPA